MNGGSSEPPFDLIGLPLL